MVGNEECFKIVIPVLALTEHVKSKVDFNVRMGNHGMSGLKD